MIHLKYKCKVNFVKLPLIWTYLCLKLVFENATAARNTDCRSVVNCARAAFADSFSCGMRRSKCDQAMHLALPPSHCKPVLSSIPTHNNPVGLSLETWLTCVTDDLQSTNPGPSMSGTSHKKFLKMLPPSSMHLWMHCRVLHVARRNSWQRSFIQTQALLMRATRSAHVSTLVLLSTRLAV
jgi:hypothetical protein